MHVGSWLVISPSLARDVDRPVVDLEKRQHAVAAERVGSVSIEKKN